MLKGPSAAASTGCRERRPLERLSGRELGGCESGGRERRRSLADDGGKRAFAAPRERRLLPRHEASFAPTARQRRGCTTERPMPSPLHAAPTPFIECARQDVRAVGEREIVGTLKTSRVSGCCARVNRRHPRMARLLANQKGKTFRADVDAGSNRGLTWVARIDGSCLAPVPSDALSRRSVVTDAGARVTAG